VDRTTLQSWLEPPGSFSTFNREERNAVALLYATLLLDGNLTPFAETIGWSGLGDAKKAEVFVEWTYVRDLWNLRADPQVRREAILGLLQPSNRQWLSSCSLEDFNAFFGATPRPSVTQIQHPGRWSLLQFAKSLPDKDEFRRTCVFKWAFNIKPDLVVHGSDGNLLCIEAKWHSSEGAYPASRGEKAEYARRGLDSVSQTEVQRFLIEDLLGFDATFGYLVRTGTAASHTHATLTWEQAFSSLETASLPTFVRDWIAAL
jgi:hypothetical protein